MAHSAQAAAATAADVDEGTVAPSNAPPEAGASSCMGIGSETFFPGCLQYLTVPGLVAFLQVSREAWIVGCGRPGPQRAVRWRQVAANLGLPARLGHLIEEGQGWPAVAALVKAMPPTALFVDDEPRNVAKVMGYAQELGWRNVQRTSTAAACDFLANDGRRCADLVVITDMHRHEAAPEGGHRSVPSAGAELVARMCQPALDMAEVPVLAYVGDKRIARLQLDTVLGAEASAKVHLTNDDDEVRDFLQDEADRRRAPSWWR